MFLFLLPAVPEAKPSPSFPRSGGSSSFTAVPTVLNYWSWKPWRIVFEGSRLCRKRNMNLHSIKLIKIKRWEMFSVREAIVVFLDVNTRVWMYPSITSISCFSAKADNCGKCSRYFQDAFGSKWMEINMNFFMICYIFYLFAFIRKKRENFSKYLQPLLGNTDL